MPTKRNHAGNQQPYIPAGNGDPSGEYGDNATGGNVHIRIERKDPIEQVEPKGSETAKPKEPGAQKYRETRTALITKERDVGIDEFVEFQKTGARLKRKWGDISDMMDAANDGMEERLCGMGHGESYWRQNWDNKGTEFFAETFQAETVNHESLELIKKYYPKSYDIFSEILRSLEK